MLGELSLRRVSSSPLRSLIPECLAKEEAERVGSSDSAEWDTAESTGGAVSPASRGADKDQKRDTVGRGRKQMGKSAEDRRGGGEKGKPTSFPKSTSPTATAAFFTLWFPSHKPFV